MSIQSSLDYIFCVVDESFLLEGQTLFCMSSVILLHSFLGLCHNKDPFLGVLYLQVLSNLQMLSNLTIAQISALRPFLALIFLLQVA